MQAHVLIVGSVQGIGYRSFVKSNAKKLGLSGWVKNLPNGAVEALFQGSKEAIEEMITLCKKGPFMAEVSNVHVTWEDETTQYPLFTIIS